MQPHGLLLLATVDLWSGMVLSIDIEVSRVGNKDWSCDRPIHWPLFVSPIQKEANVLV